MSVYLVLCLLLAYPVRLCVLARRQGRSAQRVALAMSCVSMIADPEVFVIGGGVSKAGNYLVDMLQKRYNELTPLSSKKSGIFIANLSNDAGMYGAARLVL